MPVPLTTRGIGALLLAIVVSSALGCGGSDSPEAKLAGTWSEIMASGTTGLGISFSGNGTYETQYLSLTSATTGQDDVESGLVQVTSDALTFTPQKSTCDGPVAVWTVTYRLDGGGLTLTGAGGILGFQRDTATSNNCVIQLGCFDTSAFVPHPLAAVSN